VWEAANRDDLFSVDQPQALSLRGEQATSTSPNTLFVEDLMRCEKSWDAIATDASRQRRCCADLYRIRFPGRLRSRQGHKERTGGHRGRSRSVSVCHYCAVC
jgi:hypothetical protein